MSVPMSLNSGEGQRGAPVGTLRAQGTQLCTQIVLELRDYYLLKMGHPSEKRTPFVL